MLRKTVLFIAVLTLSFNITKGENAPLDTHKANKGLFTIQFSWNKESFSDKLLVGISYKKIGFLNKQKASGYNMASVSKNGILSLELGDGEYELISVNLTGKEIGYNKVLKVPLEATFNIKRGQITNGGLVFIGKNQKSDSQVYSLRLDNTKDVQRYLAVYKKEYSNAIENIKPAYTFLANEKLDKIIAAYIETLMNKESRNARPKVKYLYTTLGIFVKMEKDSNGKVQNYKVISTPTYQEIKKATKRNNTLVCHLWNDDYLYGNDAAMDYMKLPKALEKYNEIHRFGENQFLLIDDTFNIFSSDDSFNWKEQIAYSEERSGTAHYFFPPIVYMGPKNIYIYRAGSGANKKIVSASYTDMNFEEIDLSKEIKRVPFVTETENKLVIGPVMRLVPKAKKPAYLFVKEHNSDQWQTINLPQGDCNRFAPAKKDDSIFITECGKENIRFESSNSGLTWEKK